MFGLLQKCQGIHRADYTEALGLIEEMQILVFKIRNYCTYNNLKLLLHTCIIAVEAGQTNSVLSDIFYCSVVFKTSVSEGQGNEA